MALKDVRIVDLPPMCVASSLGFGKEPEDQAWKQMQAFAASAGIRLGEKGGQTYGFNNPDPDPGSENYGYELWLPVGADVKAKPPIQIKQAPGGKYAVAPVSPDSRTSAASGKSLMPGSRTARTPARRTEASGSKHIQNPLEPDPGKWVFDLYLPIAV